MSYQVYHVDFSMYQKESRKRFTANPIVFTILVPKKSYACVILKTFITFMLNSPVHIKAKS